MTIKIEYWPESLIPIKNVCSLTITTDEMGISDEAWRDMSFGDRSDTIREYAFLRTDWAWKEV
jgi:hypothetical protein